jgi:hypothetical protein
MTTRHHRPAKKGNYVTVGGKLYPVTGKIQQAAAAGALHQVGRASAAIEHWDGHAWHRTGEVLHAAARAHATRHGGGGADMVPDLPYYAAGNWGQPGGGGGGARARRSSLRRHPTRRR